MGRLSRRRTYAPPYETEERAEQINKAIGDNRVHTPTQAHRKEAYVLSVLTVLSTIAAVLLQTTATLDRVHKVAIRDQDDLLFVYCMNRILVICPECRIAFEVTGLHEQFNVEWICDCCGTAFREHATHVERK